MKLKFKFNLKLFIILCALICLLLTSLVIRSTYARYVTSLTAKSYVEMGSWSIIVNTQNVIDNSDFTSVLTPIFNSGSEYIAADKVVPTSTGSVEIYIDYSNVKVPFRYDLTFSQDAPDAEGSTYLKDLKLTNYSIDSSVFTYYGTTISNTLTPNATKTSTSLKFNFTWDDDTGDLTDIEDTKYSRDFQDIHLNFNIKFTQIQ